MSSARPSRARLVVTLVGSILLAVGSLIGVLVLASKVVVPPSWAKATGYLTSVVRDSGTSDQLTTYDRTYSFEVNGRTYTAESTRYSRADLGSPAPIRYDPDDPSRAEVVGFWDRFIRIVLGLGVVLLFIAAAFSVNSTIHTLRTGEQS